jgi:hypothetical protein
MKCDNKMKPLKLQPSKKPLNSLIFPITISNAALVYPLDVEHIFMRLPPLIGFVEISAAAI